MTTTMAAFPQVVPPSLSSSSSSSNPTAKSKSKSKSKSKGVGFQTLGLSHAVYGGVLRMGYKVPTPIQRKTLPLALSGKDLVAMARTGSGKTAAFLIPILEHLGEHSSIYGARGLVLSPTRELAQQTYKFAVSFAKLTSLRICLLQGGDRLDAQFEALSNNPDLLVATPGRLMHVLAEVRDLSLQRVQVLVFDEADRLFEMGFAAQLGEVLRHVPEERQTMLFSATMPKQLMEFAQAGLQNPELIRLDTETKISENLKLGFFAVRPREKPAALMYLLTEMISAKDQTIVFAATRHHVEFLAALMTKEGLAFSVAYGSMDMESRKINIDKFRKRRTRFLLVTDVAARGIDIPLLNNVVNYDFPSKPKLFVHRVGRAARQGRSGTAFSFATNDEMPYVVDLHLFLGRKLKVKHQESYSISDMAPENVDCGRLPQHLLDAEVEKINKVLEGLAEAHGLIKSKQNAHDLYVKTRQDPSKRSIRRAKEIGTLDIHPLFLYKIQDEELVIENALQSIKTFRPQQTVFEVEAAKGGKQLSSTPAVQAMLHKRHAHQHVIQKQPSTTSEEPSAPIVSSKASSASRDVVTVTHTGGKRKLSKAERKRLKKGSAQTKRRAPSHVEETQEDYRDPQYYIGATPAGYDAESERHLSVHAKRDDDDSGIGKNELRSAVLDLAGDDQKDLSKQQRTYHWDKRKKKYIKATTAEHIKSKRIRNESGAIVAVKNRGAFYEKWQKQSKKRILTQGTPENMATTGERSVNVKQISRAFRKQKYESKEHADEIKDEQKIRKEVKEKEKRRAKNARGQKRKRDDRETSKPQEPSFNKKKQTGGRSLKQHSPHRNKRQPKHRRRR